MQQANGHPRYRDRDCLSLHIQLCVRQLGLESAGSYSTRNWQPYGVVCSVSASDEQERLNEESSLFNSRSPIEVLGVSFIAKTRHDTSIRLINEPGRY